MQMEAPVEETVSVHQSLGAGVLKKSVSQSLCDFKCVWCNSSHSGDLRTYRRQPRPRVTPLVHVVSEELLLFIELMFSFCSAVL